MVSADIASSIIGSPSSGGNQQLLPSTLSTNLAGVQGVADFKSMVAALVEASTEKHSPNATINKADSSKETLDTTVLQKLLCKLDTLTNDLMEKLGQGQSDDVDTTVSSLVNTLTSLNKALKATPLTQQNSFMNQLKTTLKKIEDMVSDDASLLAGIVPPAVLSDGQQQCNTLREMVEQLSPPSTAKDSVQKGTSTLNQHSDPPEKQASSLPKGLVDKEVYLSEKSMAPSVLQKGVQLPKKDVMAGQNVVQVDKKDDKSTTDQTGSKSMSFVSGTMNKVQQFVLHSGHSEPPNVSGQITDNVKTLIAQGQFKTLADGQVQLTIKLHPENLGSVQVVLNQTDEGLVATLTAHSSSTKELIQSQLLHLKDSLAANGLSVHKLEVLQADQVSSGQTPKDGSQQRQDQHHHQERDQQSSEPTYFLNDFDQDSELSFEDWFRGGEV
ncbi:flagellar hook-length control protein FliK [Pullulanibacillus pueri]|uniref:Flagellar hook-length control protein-like C-terminal domain-containing protein n=1 Tax=Pullulanibacillus pueri TaxID=1437324 RepID=A0A8J2ZWV8_9BACL|nr:flagellar hook-length control protein FliK [Pullulanibacillus pueri]MBM7682480.1 flagellar hook-length control protein FliK [Pullulanibacillus pueri]GGH82230.1 hypothetical protein GCM10007096_21310 [Pullulanibacillus pueri]